MPQKQLFCRRTHWESALDDHPLYLQLCVCIDCTMPSAHYQPLEAAQAYEDDDDDSANHILDQHQDTFSNQHYHLRYHPQLADEEQPASMSSIASRRKAGRRRCWWGLLFVSVICFIFYMMLNSQTMGYGTGTEDTGTDYEPHALGKQDLSKRKTHVLIQAQEIQTRKHKRKFHI